MAKDDILVQFEAELKNSNDNGLNEAIEQLANFGAASSLASEELQVLQEVVNTVKFNPDLKNAKEYLKVVKAIILEQNKLNSGIEKTPAGNYKSKDKIKLEKYRNESLNTIISYKKSAGIDLTNEDKKFEKELSDLNINISDLNKLLLKRAESLTLSGTKTDARAAAYIEDIVTKSGKNNADARYKNSQADWIQLRTEEEKAKIRALEEAGQKKDYDLALGKLKIIKAEREQRNLQRQIIKENRKLYGENNLRGAMYSLEDKIDSQKGLKGGITSALTGLVNKIAPKSKDAFGLTDPKTGKLIAGTGLNVAKLGVGGLVAAFDLAAKATIKFAKEASAAYKEIETTKTNLSVVYGTQGQADSVFNTIAEYAIKSPFSVSQTAEKSVLLKQTGVEDKDVMKTLKMFGDLAGGNQVKFNNLIGDYSKIMANGALDSRTSRSFAMAGVPIYEALAKYLNIDKSQVRGRIEKREISADDVFKALENLTKEGGPFFQAVEKGAKTFAARSVNLEDIKQLALANRGELNQKYWAGGIGNAILELKEAFWQWRKEDTDKELQKAKYGDALQTEEMLAKYEEILKTAQQNNDTVTVKYMEVLMQNVEQQSKQTKDQREATMANELKIKESAVLDTLALDEFKKLLMDYKSVSNALAGGGMSDAERAKTNAKRLGIETRLANDFNFRENDFENVAVYGYIEKYLNDYAKKQAKKVNTLVGLEGYDNQEFGLTRLARNSVESRGYLTNATGYVRDLSKDKTSTNNLLTEFDKYWRTTEQAKQEELKKQADMIAALKETSSEIKKFGMDVDKFGFLKNSSGGYNLISAKDFSEKASKYYDLRNAENLNFTEDTFDKDIKTYRENFNALGQSFINEYRSMVKGDAGKTKYLEDVLNKLNNAEDYEEAQDAVRRFSAVINKLSDGPLKTLGAALTSVFNIADIDDSKLDATKKTKKPNYAMDQSFANLQRRLTANVLGVSLYRTMGMDLGANGRLKDAQTVMNYFQNNENRAANKSIARALMSQQNSMSYKDISRLVVAGPAAMNKYNGSGRFAKGNVDQEATYRNMMNMALGANGSAAATNVLLNSINSSIDKLDEFVAQSFTTDDQQEQTQKMLELLNMEYRIKNGERVVDEKGNTITKNIWENTAGQYGQLLAELLTDDKMAQLGYSNSEEFRKSLTAFSNTLKESGEGNLEYTEVLMKMVDAKKKELESTQQLVKFANDIKGVQEESEQRTVKNDVQALLKSGVFYNGLSNAGITDPRTQDSLLSSLAERVSNNEDYFKNIYGKDLSTLDLTKKYIDDVINDMQVRNLVVDKISFSGTGDKTGIKIDNADEIGKINKQISDIKRWQAGAKNNNNRKDAIWLAYQEAHNGIQYSSNEMENAMAWSKQAINQPRIAKYENQRNEYLKTSADADLKSLQESLDNLKSSQDELNSTIITMTQREQAAIAGTSYAKTANVEGVSQTNLEIATALGKINRLEPFSGNLTHFNGIDLSNGNTYKQTQALIGLGLDPTMEFSELESYFRDSNGSISKSKREELDKLAGSIGIEKFNPETDNLDDYITKLGKVKKLNDTINKSCGELTDSMLKAFDSAIVDGISNSLFEAGQALRDGVDATENMGKALRDVAVNLIKNIGPQITSTGLSIAASAAADKQWGKVAGGLALAAAGGFLSFSAGMLTENDKNEDDKDAQKEARLKSLADILSDLIDQAKTDAEYYQRNVLHRKALSEDYTLSSRSVNDMIITPEGTFSTHPEDTIMAMKHPEDLMTMNNNNSYNGKMPEIRVHLVADNGQPLKIASQTQSTDANGDVDIQAVIVAVTADAIANGDMDGAFAQMQARQKGISRVS